MDNIDGDWDWDVGAGHGRGANHATKLSFEPGLKKRISIVAQGLFKNLPVIHIPCQQKNSSINLNIQPCFKALLCHDLH